MQEEYSCSFSVFFSLAKQHLRERVCSVETSILLIESTTRKVKSDDSGTLGIPFSLSL